MNSIFLYVVGAVFTLLGLFGFFCVRDRSLASQFIPVIAVGLFWMLLSILLKP